MTCISRSRRSRLDPSEQESSKFCNRPLNEVGLPKKVRRPIAGENPGVFERRQHLWILKPVDLGAVGVPRPGIRRARVEAMDSNDIDFSLGLAFERGSNLVEFDTPGLR